MNFRAGLGLLILALLSLPLESLNSSQDDPQGRVMIQQAERMIAAWQTGQPQTTNVLRVVYFVPKDVDPLPHYAERLDRVMNDVSGFYRDGLRRLGIETAGLPLERKDGKLALHLVRGKLAASGYHYESGDRTLLEIRRALKGTIDIDREYLLVFYALCRKESDGRYVFNAPYYGDPSKSPGCGVCHAADCELLDPLLLMETNRQMVFTEHYYPRRQMTVAQFNSWYLGGAAHELGHGLGLPHDGGGESEKSFGVSLMGEGNLTYRQELWGGGPPTYLGRASVLQLASHPLITGSDHGRWDEAKSAFQSLEFSVTNKTLRIQGVATGAIPPYAVIAYLWQTDDHLAQTFPCVLQNGAFTLELNGLRPGQWRLNLSRLHVNGAAFAQDFQLRIDASSVPDAAALNEAWMVDPAENAVMRHQPNARELVSDRAIAAATTPEVARKLRLLRSVLDPAAPFDLTAVRGSSAFLSDAAWTHAKVGWGQVARNYFWFDDDIQNGVFLTLDGRFHDKGLYAHSSSRFVFPVAGQWKTFTAIIGLRDGANIQGSAVFTVQGDGRQLYRSRMLRVGEREDVQVDISRVKELELLTEGGEGHNHNSWAIWAEPKVQR
jgi:hypothetical protein